MEYNDLYSLLENNICSFENGKSFVSNSDINTNDLSSQTNKALLKCEVCDFNTFIYDYQLSKQICQNCGNMIDKFEDIDVDFDAAHVRSVTNILLPQLSLNINIRGLTNPHLRNLHNWNNMPYKERSIYVIFNIIKKKCSDLKLLKCVSDEAKLLYYNIIREYYTTEIGNETKKIITRGKNKQGIIAACIYYACKKSGYIKTVKEISRVFNISTSCLNNGCKIFAKCLKKSKINFDITISRPSHFIKYICNSLEINANYIEKIEEIINKLETNFLLTDHTPYSVAIGCIILYLNNNNIEIQRKTIAKKLNISIATINKIYDLVKEYESFLLGYISILTPDAVTPNIKLEELQDSIDFINDKLKYINSIKINNYRNLTNINIHEYLVTDKGLYYDSNKYIKVLTNMI